MSAEFLREAAALMRSRVAAVRAAAEEPNSWFGADEIAASFDFSGIGEMGDARSDAEHIASWHPDVALAVADWLESVAGAMSPPPPESALDVVDAGRSIHPRDEQHALAVARAYLGRDA